MEKMKVQKMMSRKKKQHVNIEFILMYKTYYNNIFTRKTMKKISQDHGLKFVISEKSLIVPLLAGTSMVI